MANLINKREVRKRICITPVRGDGGYQVHHDMPDEHILCFVPTLELASVISRALRERAYAKIAEEFLAKHVARKTAEQKRVLHRRVSRWRSKQRTTA